MILLFKLIFIYQGICPQFKRGFTYDLSFEIFYLWSLSTYQDRGWFPENAWTVSEKENPRSRYEQLNGATFPLPCGCVWVQHLQVWSECFPKSRKWVLAAGLGHEELWNPPLGSWDTGIFLRGIPIPLGSLFVPHRKSTVTCDKIWSEKFEHWNSPMQVHLVEFFSLQSCAMFIPDHSVLRWLPWQPGDSCLFHRTAAS